MKFPMTNNYNASFCLRKQVKKLGDVCVLKLILMKSPLTNTYYLKYWSYDLRNVIILKCP